VLGFCLNDFDNNLYPVGSHYVFEYGNWINRYELMPDGSARVLSPDEAYRRALAVQTPQDLPKASRILTLLVSLGWNFEMRLRTRDGAAAPPAAAADTPEVRITRDLLREMKEYVESRGSSLVLLIIPSRGDLAAKSRQYYVAVAMCEELDLDYVEIIDDLTPNDYERPPGVHWTDSGHEKAGKALAARVRALIADREDSTARND
jgi:hypothetical protein